MTASSSSIQHFKFSTDAYHQLVEYGLLPAEARVELLEGEIIEMSPINSPHSGTINRLQKYLEKMLGDLYVISSQNPIQIDPFSEPQPDLAVLQWRDDFYFDKHPVPEEVIFLVEIADSTLEKDRTIKLPIYAKVNIPEVWIVNLKAKQLEVYTLPKDSNYTQKRIYKKGDLLEGTLVPKLKFDQVLP